MLGFRAIVMMTLVGALVLAGSLSVQGSQEMCKIKTDQTDYKPSYTKFAVTQQLHDALGNMSQVQQDSISNMAAETIADNNAGNNYGYIGYAFSTLAKMIEASLGVYC